MYWRFAIDQPPNSTLFILDSRLLIFKMLLECTKGILVILERR